MTEPEKVEHFVLTFFAATGCRVQRRDRVWIAHLPEHMAKAFGVDERLVFTFQPEQASSNVEVLTRGHRLVDVMVQYAQQRGRSCNVIYLGSQWNEIVRQAAASDPWQMGYRPAVPRLVRMVETLRSLRFVNARQRIIQRRVLYQRQALFRFRVAFCADEKREMLYSVLADPSTETIDSVVDIGGGVAMPAVWRGKNEASQCVQTKFFPTPPFGRRKNFMSREASWQAGEAALRQGNAYVWLRLYRKACEYLENHMLTEKLRFEAEAAARLAAEKNRLDAYYRGLAAETVDPLRRVFSRMAAAEMRMGWGGERGTWETRLERLRAEAVRLRHQHVDELENLAAERERRLEELLDRYRVKTEISLVQVSLIHVPRIAWNLRLTGPSRREVTVLYDIIRERILEPLCDACENMLTGNALLSCCGDVVCQSCGKACPTCGESVGATAPREVGG